MPNKYNKNSFANRFHENVNPRAKKVIDKNDASHILSSSNVCGVCQKKYKFSIKTGFSSGKEWCIHDQFKNGDPRQLTGFEQKRINAKLKPNETAVKGSDGIIRIIER